MYHLLSHTVYEDLTKFGDDPKTTFDSIRCDGLELLTGYNPAMDIYKPYTRSVHLPYAPDWLAAWEDRPVNLHGDSALYYMYGESRQQVIDNVTRCITEAAAYDPAYGVFHAGNADTPELIHRKYTRSDSYVLDSLCELMNTVVSTMPKGEPPYTILFENLWWPGLRLLDDSGFKILEKKLEFSDWGICLDTGHLMSCLPVTNEIEAIDALLKVFSGYGQELLDRIIDVHFHWSGSYEYRCTFEEQELGDDVNEHIVKANAHVGLMDNHRPFSDPRCNELLEILSPKYVAHEMPGTEKGVLEDFVKQRSLLP